MVLTVRSARLSHPAVDREVRLGSAHRSSGSTPRTTGRPFRRGLRAERRNREQSRRGISIARLPTLGVSVFAQCSKDRKRALGDGAHRGRDTGHGANGRAIAGRARRRLGGTHDGRRATPLAASTFARPDRTGKPLPEGAIVSASFTPGIPRLGIPPLLETDASLGVARVTGCAMTAQPPYPRRSLWLPRGTETSHAGAVR